MSKTYFIGHRGVPSDKNVLENTIESFNLAAKSTHDGIETDIWPTIDHKLVCCHDRRPFKFSFKKIYDLKLKQIQKKSLHGSIDYPRNSPGAFYKGLRWKKNKAPTFLQYLEICKQNNKLALVELKNDKQWSEDQKGIWTYENIDAIIDDVNKSGYSYQKIWFISLDNDLLMAFKKRFPFVQIMIIVDPNNKIKEYRDPKYFLDRNYSIDIGDFESKSTKDWGIKIDEKLIQDFHNKNLLVGTWTVNEPERVKALVALGIDFITSDYILK